MTHCRKFEPIDAPSSPVSYRKALLTGFAALVFAGTGLGQVSGNAQSIRPPAVPLVTSDPYLSIWSESNNLFDDVTRHWTRRPMELTGLIRVDGVTYRVMGVGQNYQFPPIGRQSLTVTPTATRYQFQGKHVSVGLTFLSPQLPTNLADFSRPVTYITWKVKSTDGKRHQVQIFTSMSGSFAVNDRHSAVNWKRMHWSGLTALQVSATKQTPLSPDGDDTRINWGSGYLAAAQNQGRITSSVGPQATLWHEFQTTGGVNPSSGAFGPSAVTSGNPTGAFATSLGSVSSQTVSRQFLIGYDEGVAIDYYGKALPPFWHRFGTISQMFQLAARKYPELKAKAAAFDTQLLSDAKKVGGKRYADLIALAYRECIAANGLAEDAHHQPLLFTKENTSNGDIATVDVMFPMSPIWLLLNPHLAEALLESNFAYAASPLWKFPNAPHDLGTYPKIMGREDGGEGMPVEESGNMILMCDGIAKAEGSPAYAKRWWPQLTQWANYLVKYGLDPEDQLCTDDFMGHLAHNANLSVKAILALGAYADLCQRLGLHAEAQKFHHLAKVDANHWMQVAMEGDHSLLAFDKPGTWSQKYNLVWDSVLGLNLFPKSLAATEIAYYKGKLNRYGVPLDSRTTLTKSDWSIWSASMATNLSDFEAIVSPIWDYMNETTTRDPMADSYITTDLHSGGMHARPVVGGFFMRFLENGKIWKKWASQAPIGSRNWAPLPKPPTVYEVVPSSKNAPQTWKYTTQKPEGGWTAAGFDDSTWSTGPGGFGSDGTPGAVVGTQWTSDDIWIRRTVKIPTHLSPAAIKSLMLYVYHDEDVQVYFNGVLALSLPEYENSYIPKPISPAAKALLRPGATLCLAVHCHQTVGGQGVDVGICRVVPN